MLLEKSNQENNWGGCQMGNAISIIEEDKNSDCSFFANEGFVSVKAVN